MMLLSGEITSRCAHHDLTRHEDGRNWMWLVELDWESFELPFGRV